MSRAVSLTSSELFGAAIVLPRDDSRLAALLSVTMGILALVLAGFFYVRQLNRRHARLLADLEDQLAERRKAEENLRTSEGFYHSLVESLPQSILRKDMEGRFTFVNRRFCAVLGRTPDAILGTTDSDHFPDELAEKYRRDDKRVIEEGKTFNSVEEHVTPQGEKLYVHVIKTPLEDLLGNVIGVQGIFLDVTERKRAEEQLKMQNVLLQEMARSEHEAHLALKQAQSQMVQNEKLASLGELLAGVAHEINNPISFVNNNVAVLDRYVGEMRDLIVMYQEGDDLIARERPELAERLREFREDVEMDYTLENIQGLIVRSRDGLRRIHQIVGDLRDFARLGEGEMDEADLNAGIESTVSIITGHARKKRVSLETDLQPLPPVICNASKVNQVVMNLLSNAVQACPEEGAVSIRTRAEEDGVRIEVADTGPGIDPSIRDRIFDPFFTTKAAGEGTGLGLSISYSIIQDHGGTIQVDSPAGQGACFTIRLPLRPKEKEMERARGLGGELPTVVDARADHAV